MPMIYMRIGSESITVLKGMNEYLPIIPILRDRFGWSWAQNISRCAVQQLLVLWKSGIYLLVTGDHILIFDTGTLLRGCFVFWILNSILLRVHLQVTVLFLLCLIFLVAWRKLYSPPLLTFIRLSLNKWCWSWWLLWWQCLNNWTPSPTFSLLSRRGCIRWCVRLSRVVFAPSYFCIQV